MRSSRRPRTSRPRRPTRAAIRRCVAQCSLAAGRTVLIATQRFSTVEVADRAVVLDDGVILEDGEPHELLSRDGPFSRLFGEEVLAA